MEKLRESTLTKMLCYILIPIMGVILIASILNIVLFTENGSNIKPEEYIETESFSNEYLSSIYTYTRTIKNAKRTNPDNEPYYYTEINDNSYEGKVYYRSINYDDYSISRFINYIIIDESTGNLYTNIKTSDYNLEIQEMANEPIYWTYENDTINTNIENLNQENAKYIISTYYSSNALEGFKIYTNLNPEDISYSNSFYIQKTIYNLFERHQNYPAYLIPITSILIVAMIIYLIWAIGHEKGKEGIQLNGIDKFSFEVLTFFVVMVVGIMCSGFVAGVNYNMPQELLIPIMSICYIIAYASTALYITTIIKRIKAKEFWHTFTTYRIYRWIKNQLNKTFRDDKHNKIKTSRKIIILYVLFIIASIILAGVGSFIAVILLLALWFWTLYKLLEYNKKMNKIQTALQDIYEGKSDVHLNEEELTGVLKSMAKYINDIAGGFSNAIEQSLKSERLKTELITNVSHDIKTPLTSIINYVDLLKKEDINNATIEQYIAILDKKSQRLKKLIEDLVEASKVSSGNVKLNLETINLKELINQAIGEFEDKFKEKGLKIDLDVTNEDVKIQADNRYMYRIIDNLFSNISKYAMENTRVYINLQKTQKEIKLEIKNISATRLNISAEELMQRFVRGDKSRYTEGSGLGLSIAESLTEIQGGTFKISIDGDLFKVTLRWNME